MRVKGKYVAWLEIDYDFHCKESEFENYKNVIANESAKQLEQYIVVTVGKNEEKQKVTIMPQFTELHEEE